MRLLATAVGLMLLALTPLATHAEDAAPVPAYATETLTGDWGGGRSELYRRGIALEGFYRIDAVRNISGGMRNGGRPMTHLDLKMNADLDRLWGWSDTTAYVNLIDDRGGKVNANMTGSLLGVSSIEVPVSTTRLFHAWLLKDFADQQASVLVGLYPIDSEFMVIDSASVFVQPPYGALADLALTRGPSIFNNPAFGLRVKWTSTDRSLYAQGAVLDGVPGNPAHPKGTHIAFMPGDGTMSIVEFGFRPGDTGQALEPSTDVFGKYAVGFWSYSTQANDLMDTDGAGMPLQRKSRGGYALAEKTLLKGSPIGDVSVFYRVSASDGDSTAIRNSQNLGLRLKGMLPGRGDDVFGLAYTRAGLSNKFIQSQANNGIVSVAKETAWELTYRYQATPWLAIQPLMQHFRYPGGNQAVPKASVAGLRMDITF